MNGEGDNAGLWGRSCHRPSEVGLRLDDEHAILCRVGLHCAPAAHKTLGTFPVGAVRFGLAAMNTAEEVRAAIDAVRQLARQVP